MATVDESVEIAPGIFIGILWRCRRIFFQPKFGGFLFIVVFSAENGAFSGAKFDGGDCHTATI